MEFPLDNKIASQKYEMKLIDLIKDNYVILITASPYKRSHKILRDIKQKTGFVPNESFWNFGKTPCTQEVLDGKGCHPSAW